MKSQRCPFLLVEDTISDLSVGSRSARWGRISLGYLREGVRDANLMRILNMVMWDSLRRDEATFEVRDGTYAKENINNCP